MEVLLGTVFVASLLGSLHCVGMCGPFALIAANSRNASRTAWLPTLAYSLGRLVSYVAVGLIFGTLGLTLNAGSSMSSVTNWQQTATYAAGGLMVIVGLVALARCLGWQVRLPKMFAPLQTALQGAFAKTREMSPGTRALTIGVLTSLMPCGWLYTFAITAAGTGSPIWGGVLMATFWAGTVPIMVALMMGFNKVGVSIQKHVPVAMAVLVIAVGLFTIAWRAPVAVADDSIIVVTKTEALVEQVNEVDHEKLPCCRGAEE